MWKCKRTLRYLIFDLYSHSSRDLHSMFHFFLWGNRPAPSVWVFIAQLVEHSSANAEAMGSGLKSL